VDLGSSSEGTLFAEDYHRERTLQYIDNINVFYVALTRAKYGLRVIADLPPKKFLEVLRTGKDPEWKNLSQLLYVFVGKEDYHAGTMYDFRSLKRKAGPAQPLEVGYPSFPAGERGRLKVSRDAADYFGPDGLVGPDASNRLRGLVLHDILASVTVPGDLSRAVDRAVATGELPKADRERTLRFLEAEIASVASRGWFAEEGIRVLNESPLIGPGGADLRPDRVILRPDGSAAIVDYKRSLDEHAVSCEQIEHLIVGHIAEFVLESHVSVQHAAGVEELSERFTAGCVPFSQFTSRWVINLYISAVIADSLFIQPLLRFFACTAFRITYKKHVTPPVFSLL
jgi:hypothetical protein